MDHEMKRVKNGKLLLIPASAQTAGMGPPGVRSGMRRGLANRCRRSGCLRVRLSMRDLRNSGRPAGSSGNLAKGLR